MVDGKDGTRIGIFRLLFDLLPMESKRRRFPLGVCIAKTNAKRSPKPRDGISGGESVRYVSWLSLLNAADRYPGRTEQCGGRLVVLAWQTSDISKPRALPLDPTIACRTYKLNPRGIANAKIRGQQMNRLRGENASRFHSYTLITPTGNRTFIVASVVGICWHLYRLDIEP